MAKSFKINGKTIDGETQVKQWVINRIDKDAIDYAEKFGADLAHGKDALTTSQIRNVFGEVRRIQMKNRKTYEESSILLLRPKLAYSAKRARGNAVKDLADVLSQGINAVVTEGSDDDKKKRFNNFADFFEAVLAYHKKAGGKEN